MHTTLGDLWQYFGSGVHLVVIYKIDTRHVVEALVVPTNVADLDDNDNVIAMARERMRPTLGIIYEETVDFSPDKLSKALLALVVEHQLICPGNDIRSVGIFFLPPRGPNKMSGLMDFLAKAWERGLSAEPEQMM